MDVSTTAWWITIVVTIAVLTFDVVIVGRKPHEPSMKECAIYISIYSGLAVLFGLWIWVEYSGRFAGEFYAGWLTEYSLSIDNLFVFIIIMSRFGVPRKYQQEALLVGIILGAHLPRDLHRRRCRRHRADLLDLLHLRRVPHLHRLDTGQARRGRVRGEQARHVHQEPPQRHRQVARPQDRGQGERQARHHADAHRHRRAGIDRHPVRSRLDPAIYGLTQEPYLVLTANIFALMGLRQLYFLLGGLLTRLVYLSYGLAFISPSSASSWSCTRCTPMSCRSSTAASTSMCRRSRPG
jgi:tellurite resistance protein TerC